MLKKISEKQKLAFAHIGTLIKGFIHNMNSPMSAVFGRTEMLQIRLNKLRQENIPSALTGIIDKCLNDTEIIHSNCKTINHMTSNLIHKCISCESDQNDLLDLTRLFKDEIAFMNCHMDFKHNFSKNIMIKDNIYLKNALYVDFSNTLNKIIYHSINTLNTTENKQIGIRLTSDAGYILMEFRDNGPEIRDAAMKSAKSDMMGQKNRADPDIEQIAAQLAPYNASLDIFRQGNENIVRIKIPQK